MKEVQGMAFLLCAIVSVSIIFGCVGAEQQKQAPNTGTIPHKSVIASLDPNSVFKTISTNRGPTLIEFYSPGCGHCKNFAPMYELISADLWAGGVNPAKVDARAAKAVAKEFKVRGVPTLFLLPTPATEVTDAIEFLGTRDYLSIFSWVRETCNVGIVALDSQAAITRFFPNFLTPIPRFVVVSESTDLANSINLLLRKQALIGHASPKDLHLLQQRFPALLASSTSSPLLLVSDSIKDPQQQLHTHLHGDILGDSNGMPYYLYKHTISDTGEGVEVDPRLEEFLRAVIAHAVGVSDKAGLLSLGGVQSQLWTLGIIIVVVVIGVSLVCYICHKMQNEEHEMEAKEKDNKKK